MNNWEVGRIINARKRMSKIKLYFISGVKEKNRTVAVVVYRDKNKVKAGLISDPFYVRHGINVISTFSGDNNWWFESADVSKRILGNPVLAKTTQSAMEELWDNGELLLAEIDLDGIKFEY